jgi:hypothetical protein
MPSACDALSAAAVQVSASPEVAVAPVTDEPTGQIQRSCRKDIDGAVVLLGAEDAGRSERRCGPLPQLPATRGVEVRCPGGGAQGACSRRRWTTEGVMKGAVGSGRIIPGSEHGGRTTADVVGPTSSGSIPPSRRTIPGARQAQGFRARGSSGLLKSEPSKVRAWTGRVPSSSFDVPARAV